MKKQLVFLIAMLVSLFIFSACSPSGGGNNGSNNQNPGVTVPDTDPAPSDPDSSDGNICCIYCCTKRRQHKLYIYYYARFAGFVFNGRRCYSSKSKKKS